jgi:hypothetical protein
MKKRHGSGEVAFETSTGVRLSRGYTLEPDLLIEISDDETEHSRLDSFPDILRQCGFKRIREARWAKDTKGTKVLLDLFAPDTTPDDVKPTSMTSLYRSELAQRRPQLVSLQLPAGELQVRIPNALGFLALKTDAKMRIRPKETKDSFDAYIYVAVIGVDDVAQALAGGGTSGSLVAKELFQLFASRSSAGVKDVVAQAHVFGEESQLLLSQSVVDLFESLREKINALQAPEP